MLEVDQVSVSYGAVQALDVEAASVCALIGANGAGKSRLMKAISGLMPVRGGAIRLEGRAIQDVSTERRVALGVALSPEGRRLFLELSVRENLLMWAYLRRDRAALLSDLERTYAYFPRVKERERSQGRHLSGGEQQMCAIGRALMSRPRLLLLDEPSLGLAPAVTLEVAKAIRQISQDGTTIILVEQNAQLALKLSSRAVVLETGRLTLSSDSQSILNNPQVAMFNAERHPAKVVVSDNMRALSSGQFCERIQAVAHYLAGLDVRAGGRVAVMAANSINYLALLYTTALGGFAVVPVNTRYGLGELRHLIANAAAQGLLA